MEYGTVEPDSAINVPYGTQISADGSTLTVSGSRIIAFPADDDKEWCYPFKEWSAPERVEGTTTVTAVF